MAKKKTVRPKMVVGKVKAGSEIRHIQIQLPVTPYEQGQKVARANGLSMAAYVRQAILKQIREDMEEMEGSK
jgi:hypothetical protein